MAFFEQVFWVFVLIVFLIFLLLFLFALYLFRREREEKKRKEPVEEGASSTSCEPSSGIYSYEDPSGYRVEFQMRGNGSNKFVRNSDGSISFSSGRSEGYVSLKEQEERDALARDANFAVLIILSFRRKSLMLMACLTLWKMAQWIWRT